MEGCSFSRVWLSPSHQRLLRAEPVEGGRGGCGLLGPTPASSGVMALFRDDPRTTRQPFLPEEPAALRDLVQREHADT